MSGTTPIRLTYLLLGVASFVALWGLLGCKPHKYRRASDKEVYEIIDDRSELALGKRMQHSIDTAYSERTPDDILGDEIIQDRNRTDANRTLTLTDTLNLAVKTNRTYQFNREKLYLQALALTNTRNQFAFRLKSVELDVGLNRSSEGSEKTVSNANITAEKLLKAGGSISTSLVNDLVLYFDGTPKVPSITLSLTQPLLRGAGSDIATEVLTQAERNVVYEIRDFTHFRNEFALEIFEDYLNLLQLGQSMRLSYTNYQNRIFFRQEVDARAEGGLAAEFEAKQALQSEYTAKLSYVGTVNSYRNSLDNLKQKLALPLNTNLKLDFKVLDDLRDMGLPEMPLDEISGYRLALDNRLDLMNVIDRFEDSKRKVKVAKSDLLPGLSIVADAALRDQFYSSFQTDSIETKAGLKLNLPFDRLSERNAYRSSLIAFERQLRTLSTELDKVLDGLRSDLRNLSRQRQNYFTQLEARKNAEENLEATQQRLRLGFPGVRTRDVITAQDALLQSQLSVLGAGLEHHKTRLKLLKDMGTLNTTQDEFWLKNVGIPEQQQPQPGQLPQPLEEVIPPEQILGQ